MGNPIPTFIQRRIVQLDEKGVSCVCLVRKGQEKTMALQNGQLVVMPMQKLAELPALVTNIYKCLLYPSEAMRLWQYRPNTSFLRNITWFLAHLSLTGLGKINLIHLQWISMADDYAWLPQWLHCPMFASARGSQVTVYPHTDAAFAQKLSLCFKAADYIHCVSEDILQQCLKLGAPAHKLFVNYNGVDIAFFSPPNSPRQIPDKALAIVSTGALIWRKGYIFQLQILQQLLNKGVNCHLFLIGSGPDKQGLQYMAHLLGIEPYVTFCGALPPQQVREYLLSAHIYLTTSAAEGLANSVLEAVSCGVPVVGFYCEGIREILGEETSNCFVPYGNTNEVTEKIIRVTETSERYAALSRKIRLRVEQIFNADDCVEQMIHKMSAISEHE